MRFYERDYEPQLTAAARENSARYAAAAAAAKDRGRYLLYEDSTIFTPAGESFGYVFSYKPEFREAAAEMVRLANAALDAAAAAKA